MVGSGVVEEHVHAPVGLLRPAHHRLPLAFVGDVVPDKESLAARTLYLLDGLVAPIGVYVGDDDGRALFGEPDTAGPPYL